MRASAARPGFSAAGESSDTSPTSTWATPHGQTSWRVLGPFGAEAVDSAAFLPYSSRYT